MKLLNIFIMPGKKRVDSCLYMFKSGPLGKEVHLLHIVLEGSFGN